MSGLGHGLTINCLRIKRALPQHGDHLHHRASHNRFVHPVLQTHTHPGSAVFHSPQEADCVRCLAHACGTVTYQRTCRRIGPCRTSGVGLLGHATLSCWFVIMRPQGTMSYAACVQYTDCMGHSLHVFDACNEHISAWGRQCGVQDRPMALSMHRPAGQHMANQIIVPAAADTHTHTHTHMCSVWTCGGSSTSLCAAHDCAVDFPCTMKTASAWSTAHGHIAQAYSSACLCVPLGTSL